MRIVRRPDGDVLRDPSGRLAGRGAYLCRAIDCWSEALRRGSVAKALDAASTPALRSILEAGPGQQTSSADMTTNDEGGPGGTK